MLNLHQLRLLRELAHRGTIAAVADVLAYTPSAVSQQLSALERKTGVSLLERTGRRVVLTPAGVNLVRHAEVILEHLEAAEAELMESKGVAGPLRVGIYPSAAGSLSGSIFTALRRSHPRLELWVQEIDPSDASNALRGGQLDLALLHSYEGLLPPVEPGVHSTPIFAERMLLAAPADPSALGWTVHETDDPVRKWQDVPWILPAPGTLCHTVVTRLCETNGFHVSSWHRVDDYHTTLGLVAAGAGVAIVPELSAQVVPPGATVTPLPLLRRSSVAFRVGGSAKPAISAFIEALREALPEGLATADV
ncbi:LysR family transcriptional regulator [Streptomyces zaomyceticus]|uniref:LysR substrate-binding domain-containing protein n=1 Tax=Streptomyces zaomyceticus TaxID=68286 RepID=A0ABZ1L547_9ACTN|nr:LysR substrate-binding domain-containing protein [Streptomyces zaomyceticus]WSQ21681.1 LysR substrate-binding domain-containing protein [Streptomyces zaomyceticus]GHG16810.1 LysR family transcriptional regulator [Streptomyces zaomyceticus]